MAPAILGRASGAIAGGTWSPLPLAAALLLLATPTPAPPRWRLARGLPGAEARRGEGLANAGIGFGAAWRALGPRAGVLAPSAPGEAEAAVAIRRARRQGGLVAALPCWDVAAVVVAGQVG